MKWIDPGKRLPDHGDPVLFVMSFRSLLIESGDFAAAGSDPGTSDPVFIDTIGDTFPPARVVAWMPTPDPPKGPEDLAE